MDDSAIGPCPLCAGPRGVLGVLGRVLHLLCRDCGMMFTADAVTEGLDDDTEQ